MSELRKAKRKRKTQCKIWKGQNGKYRCVTHNQALLYVYECPAGVIGYRCQVGEDLRPPSKITNDLWEDDEKSDLCSKFKERIGRYPTANELEKIKLYLSNEERDTTDDNIRQEAVDYLIKNWNILPKATSWKDFPENK